MKNTPTDPQYIAMKEFCVENDDMPDGAFFALAEDMHDWTIDDWIWFSEIETKEKFCRKN